MFLRGAWDEDVDVVQDIGSGGDELCTLLDEAIGAGGGGAVDLAWDGVHVPALVDGLGGGYEGAAAEAGFHYEDTGTPAGDDTIAHGKCLGISGDLHGELGDDGAGGGDFLGKEFVFAGVEFQKAGAEDGDGATLGGEGALVGSGVDAAGEAADDGEAGVGKLVAEFLGGLDAVMAGLPGTDDPNGVEVARQEIAPDIEQDGWGGDLAQERGVIGGIVRDDFCAKVGDSLELGGEIDVALPSDDGIGDFRAHALDGAELRGAGKEDTLGALEHLEETAKAGGTDAGEHIEGDIGLGGGHGADSEKRECLEGLISLDWA